MQHTATTGGRGKTKAKTGPKTPVGIIATQQRKREETIALSKILAKTIPPKDYGELTWLETRVIRVDPEYQRGLNPDSVDKIVRKFDPKLLQPLSISLREDNDYYCIDGQHRLAAAVVLGLERVPVVLHLGMSGPEEAAHFVALQDRRVALLAHQRFAAMVAASDPEALAVAGILASNGFRVLNGRVATRGSKLNQFSGTIALLAAYRIDAGKTLNNALGIVRAAFGEDPSNGRILLLKSLVHFLRGYGTNPRYNKERLIERLRRMAANDFTGRTISRSATLRCQTHVAGAAILVDIHDENLRATARIVAKA